MSHRAVIGLGSNLGKREFYIRLANRLVEWEVGRVVQRSSVIETPAWGFESDPFLNQVIVVETELSPLELLDVLQGIERRLGRTQKSTVEDGKPVYHARTIDLDILDYDRMRYHDDRLTLPHPRIAEREFVLASLRELGISIAPKP
jgi:2-amino-4-hydroxy-6-hydroxymethyldihydropteridine diphosphokinase